MSRLLGLSALLTSFAAFAVGAGEVYIALKSAFSRETEAVTRAVEEIQRAGICSDCTVNIVGGPDEYLYGEEKALLDAAAAAAALVVVVPRHPRRFDEVALLAQARRSRQPLPAPEDRVYLGDTMGEMAFYYGACDVAIIGGSFAPLGGQNLIEALAAGAPVVLGPHMFNFAEATQLAVQAGAAIRAADASSAMQTAMGLLSNREQRRGMSEAGKNLIAAHRGATARHLAACRRLLRL